MKLIQVDISGYRSVNNGSLNECGDFNVLIGKNNAGKSNILSAIDGFFSGIREGYVSSLKPSLRRPTDHFDRKTDTPIVNTMTFSLSLAERDLLIRDIVGEAPQLQNAMDGISTSLKVSITWKITSEPVKFGYVSDIILSATDEDQGLQHKLLQVTPEAAEELFQRHTRTTDTKAALSTVSLFLNEVSDIWQSYTRDGMPQSLPLRFWLERYKIRASRMLNESALSELQEKLDAANTQEELVSSVKSYEKRLNEELRSIENDPIRTTVKTFSGEDTNIPGYILSLLERVASLKLLYLRERREAIGEDEAQNLLNLKTRRGGEQRLNTIQQTVSSLLGVKIDAFTGSESGSGRKILAELDVDEFLVQVNGAGVREALRIVLDYEFQHPDILLVEEPEIHLHPALEIAMMRYLKSISEDCQVFITTHSTNFLDIAEMNNVYLVSRDGDTRVQLVDFAAAESTLPRELGLRLSSFFMFDRIVFVEGPSDEAVLREFATILEANFGQANVGFIPMGGARKFGYFASETSLSFLTNRRVKVWFLLDQDEGGEEKTKALFENLGSQATIKVLRRREIENYLLLPRAVAEFIRLKLDMAGRENEAGPDAAEVEAALVRHADQLQDLTIAKHVAAKACSPVYPALKGILESESGIDAPERLERELTRMKEQLEERSGTVAGIYSTESEAIKAKWETAKLHMVQGDILLDTVCREFGVRFKKDADSARIANIMTKEEIDSEIVEFVRSLVE